MTRRTELGEVDAVLEISHSRVGAHVPEDGEHERDDHQEAEHQQPGNLERVSDDHELRKMKGKWVTRDAGQSSLVDFYKIICKARTCIVVFYKFVKLMLQKLQDQNIFVRICVIEVNLAQNTFYLTFIKMQ